MISDVRSTPGDETLLGLEPDDEDLPLELAEIDPAALGPDPADVIELNVGRASEIQRLDLYVVATLPGTSRSLVQRGIDQGLITINGLKAKASSKVRPGDRLKVQLPEPPHPRPIPENIPLQILYEDECLAVVNKPPDMVVHPAKGNWSGTLVNALRYHFLHLSAINGDYRPGIVHRLDRDTSGAILIAKAEDAHRELAMQFETRKVFKEYHVLVAGTPDRDSDYVERAIGPHPVERVKKACFAQPDELKGIKPACTFYEVIERFDGFAYLRAYPKTGRTHQIRLHVAAIGCPVLADELYSGRGSLLLSQVCKPLPATEADRPLLTRQALHARKLRFIHPRTKHWLEVEAPLPEEFENTLHIFRSYRPRKR